MITTSSFRRRLIAGGEAREVELEPGQVRWLEAQSHTGENIGDTPTEVLFVELKEAAAATRPPDSGLALGPRD